MDWSHFKEGDTLDTEQIEQIVKRPVNDPGFMTMLLHVAQDIQNQHPELYICAKDKRIRALAPDEAVADNAESTARHLKGIMRQGRRYATIPAERVSEAARPAHASMGQLHMSLALEADKQLHQLQLNRLLRAANNQPDEDERDE